METTGTPALRAWLTEWLSAECDVLLIVPPMGDVYVPSLAAHVLQASARASGIRVRVFYANMVLAAMIGEGAYESLWCGPEYSARIGERLFAAAAFDVPRLGLNRDRLRARYRSLWSAEEGTRVGWDELEDIERRSAAWADLVASAVADRQYPIVGCTTAYQQTASSVALLSRIKRQSPEVLTLIGGANCEGEMADGIASLDAGIDFVFSGESEATFVRFARAALAGKVPSDRIVHGSPCRDLDALPPATYEDFFEQLGRHFPDSAKAAESVVLPYESSRGCWWGQKHHCTFCGLNGMGMQYREKSAEVVDRDLRRLAHAYPVRRVAMVDNIMPHSYFRTLLPRLASEPLGIDVFYEVKANLSLEKVLALRGAGIVDIQPGIEAFSSALLARMKKGVTASQNVALLRYARSAQFERVQYILLYGFPGDQRCDYEQTLALLPLLRHLYPPIGVHHVSIDRFSPYFDHSEEHGVRNVRPVQAYAEIFPPNADLERLAYHFVADFDSGSVADAHLVAELKLEVSAWRRAWCSDRPVPELSVHAISPDTLFLLDTRGVPGTQQMQLVTRAQAAAALIGGGRRDPDVVAWAIAERLAVELDGSCVPLATAEPALLHDLDSESECRGAAGPDDVGADTRPSEWPEPDREAARHA